MRRSQDVYGGVFRDYVEECLRSMGKNFEICEICGDELKKPYIHHTKYDGATVYDLQIVCCSCNLKLPQLYLT